jgi:hypothetical protein
MPSTMQADAAAAEAMPTTQNASQMSANTQPTTATSDKNLSNLKQWTLDQLQRLRNFRRPYDQRRALWYRQYIGQRDRRLYPDNLTPRSNTFVPYPSSDTEAVVSRVHDAFFSIDPPLEVRPRGGNDYAATQMQNVMLTTLHRAKWIEHIEMLSRDICIYGHSALKVDWDWDYDIVTGPEPVYQFVPQTDPNTGQPITNPQGQPVMLPVMGPDGQPIIVGTKMVTKQVPRNCPKISVIDIYDLLIDPDRKQKAHVSEISWGELQRISQAKPDMYLPEALAELQTRLSQYKDLDRDGIIIRYAEFWDDTNKTVTIVTFGEDADAIGWKDRRYQYRNASYSAYKRRVYNGPPVLLYTGPNPFAHKRIPIIDCPYIQVKGDVYGIGLIEKISDLTEGMNVFTNMITDNWNLGINRRYAYDVMTDIDHDQLNQGNVPGGKVGVVGDPSKAIFPLPSFTPNAQDYQILDLYKNMIEMTSGISDFYAQGAGSSGGNSTASGISQVINQSGYVFKLFIRNMENKVLQPMMEMVASMIQQYGSPEMEYSITNTQPGIPTYGRVALEALVGSYDFDFVAANYATGKVVKQRNLMAFYNIALQSPYCNQAEFLREIARAMEIPYANRLLKGEDQVQQEQMMAQKTAIQQNVLDHLLKFESKALEGAIKKKEPNTVTGHAHLVQKHIEDYLAEQAGVPLEVMDPTVRAARHEGRPSQSQHEGAIPGSASDDGMASFAQQNGANALGTSGT